MTVKELREKRAALAKQANEVLVEAKANECRMTSDQEKKFDDIHKDIDALTGQIERSERQEDLERKLAGQHLEDTPAETRDTKLSAEERSEAIRAWALGGSADIELSERQRDLCKRAGLNPGRNEVKFAMGEQRALAVGTGAAGGYTVPEGFVPSLEKAMEDWGAVRETSRVIRTATGNDLPMPTATDTANVGVLLAENTQVSEAEPTFGQLTLHAYKFSSKAIRVSMEMLQDTSVNLEQYLGEIMGERLAKAQNDYYTTGTGSGQPNGIVTASTLGKTAASATAISYAELVDLEHSVNAVYRKGAKWMFSDAVLAALKKLLDGENRPLWTPGMTANAPNMVLGYPYVVNYDMASSIAASAKTVLFGQLQKYLVRECTEVIVQRLVERYADYHQVGFLASVRSDGDLLDAGTHPVKHLIQAAS
jgi:HK97 family phage major capsid protein